MYPYGNTDTPRPGSQTPQGIPSNLADFGALRANFQADVNQKLGMRQLEWLYTIPVQIVVPANSGAPDVTVNIKSDAHFECFFLTGSFTTLNVAGADDGTNHISVRISDGSNDLKMMDNFIPANLFMSPGRVLAPATAGNPSNTLFYPFPFYHIFPASGGIIIESQNAGGSDNTLNLLFWGKKLRASTLDSNGG
jgi:hypothetical protein